MWVEIVRRGFVQDDQVYVDLSLGKANTFLSMGIAVELKESSIDAEIQKLQELKEELFDGTHPECISVQQEQEIFEAGLRDKELHIMAFDMARNVNVKERQCQMTGEELGEMADKFYAELKAAPEKDTFTESIDNKMVKPETVKTKKTRGRPKRQAVVDNGEYNING